MSRRVLGRIGRRRLRSRRLAGGGSGVRFSSRSTGGCTVVLVAAFFGQAAGQDLSALRVLGPDYPRAYFFRSSEGLAANPRVPYERWERCFSRLMGIEGKVLEEEVPGRSLRNIDFFTRFKRQHPEQLVLLHYNGNARDPRFEPDAFFAGHFLYYAGARILDDVPAEEGETEIRVSDTSCFRTGIGRYRQSNDDIGLCLLDEQGHPDWQHSEQVQLMAVDPERKVIRVRRACYGTRPMALPGERAYAAAHVTEGPWGRQSHLLWYYNYSTTCPRDAAGRNCADVHGQDLARRFLPGGELAAFDGLEFDVLHHQVGGGRGRGPDCNADGQPDHGIIDGVNTYGIGVFQFCRALRRKLGPGRLILADGMTVRNQRAFGSLNGIESEGWPTLSDWEIRDWSGGLNRHRFWAENGHPPVFNYVNHKFTTAGPTPGSRVRPDVPWSVHRLVFAAAMFTDSAVCYAFSPPAEPGEMLGVWDELRRGRENQLGWLGRPLGPPVRRATRCPDALAGQGTPPTRDLARRVSGTGITTALDRAGLKIQATDPQAPGIRFRLRGVPCNGPDLVVSVTARGSPRPPYPAEMARLMWVGVAPPEGQLVRAELPESGMCLRGHPEEDLDPETGASVRFVANCNLGGHAHTAYLVHPPFRTGTGYTFWTRDVTVPKKARLVFYSGMGEKSPQRSDGVTFRVLAAPVSPERTGPFRQLFEHTQKAFQWVRHEVGLAEYAGQRLRLKFVSDCGPHDNSTTDHSYWGDVVVTGPEGTRFFTSPARHMTWVNQQPFTSHFYFPEIRSPAVDLEVEIEGGQPVWITAIQAYHHPDAIARRFEHGLVLANPSPRPYTWRLAEIAPGQHFRRLRGSPRQDPETNNGSPVHDPLILGPQDALFLQKE